MSGAPEELDLIDNPEWLEEPLCGLPESAAKEGHGVLDMVPGLSSWLNSSAATPGGRLVDAVLGGAGSVLLGQALGGITHVPFLGGIVDAAVSKILKKVTRIDFSLKGTVNLATRSAAMAIEGRATGKRQGAAVLRAQALLGKLTNIGAIVNKRGNNE